MEYKNGIFRCNFVGTAAAGAAALSVVPALAMASVAKISELRLGYIGVGLQSHRLIQNLNTAYQLQPSLKWGPGKEHFIGDDYPNLMLTRGRKRFFSICNHFIG